MTDYLEYWKAGRRDYTADEQNRVTFFLDFITQLGIKSAGPEVLDEGPILDWVDRIEVMRKRYER